MPSLFIASSSLCARNQHFIAYSIVRSSQKIINNFNCPLSFIFYFFFKKKTSNTCTKTNNNLFTYVRRKNEKRMASVLYFLIILFSRFYFFRKIKRLRDQSSLSFCSAIIHILPSCNRKSAPFPT